MFDKLKGNAPSNNTKQPAPPKPALDPDPVVPVMPPSTSNNNSGNVLSEDVFVKGKIKLTSNIEIDGQVEGEIITKGTIIFNKNARIKASIQAGCVIVHGKIEGNIEASDKIELLKTSNVQGDITANTLKVEPGAMFQGNSFIGKTSALTKKAPKNNPSKSSSTS